MVSTVTVEVLTLLVLLGLSGFFSGSETALFALSDSDLDRMARSKQLRRRRAVELVRSPESTLVTILFANMVVNVGISVLTTSVALRMLGPRGLAVAIPVTSVLLLLFGEIVPKSAGLRRRREFAQVASNPLWLLRLVLGPLQTALVRTVEWLVGRPSNLPLQADEIPTAIELAEEEGQITPFEGRVFQRTLGFAQMPVGRCLTPRVDMVTVGEGARREEILRIFEESGRSRLPVTGEDVEDVRGILLLKDVLTRRPDEDFAAGEIMREAIFEPETLSAGELFRRFQARRLHLAIIVGEHGGVEGVVTLEDLLEELVGEIHDEADEEPLELEEIDVGVWWGDAGLEVDEVADRLREHADFPEHDEAVTISGILQDELGRVPSVGDEVEWGPWRLRVLTAAPNRARQIEIRRARGGEGESS